MEEEPRPENTYMGMPDEYLYGVISELQLCQREINAEYSLVQAALVANYTARLHS